MKIWLSRFVGGLARLESPTILVRLINFLFAWYYRLDLSQADRPLSDFCSLDDLFTRRLKPGARTVKGELISPVDGTFRAGGRILDGQIPQIKGVTYSVSQLLAHPDLGKKFECGSYVNLYLCPRDYHRVHMPVTGRIVETRHVPGERHPVNDRALNSIPGLFVRNERRIFLIDSKLGDFALVMVGALNVGWIDEAIRPSDSDLGVGLELATFHFGSSVVLLSEKAETFAAMGQVPPRTIQMGDKLAP